jgi:hypothetical protein
MTALSRWLKHRPRNAVRPVPPDLVALLRWHVTAYGIASDGRLFRTQRGGRIQDTEYGEVRDGGPRTCGTPAQPTHSSQCVLKVQVAPSHGGHVGDGRP